MKPVAQRHLARLRPRCHALRDNRSLLRITPAAPPRRSRQNLHPTKTVPINWQITWHTIPLLDQNHCSRITPLPPSAARWGSGSAYDEAATQIERLTILLAETQKSLSEAKSKPVSVENRSRDPRRLYEDNNPIAEVQDPKLDLDNKKIVFPAVNSTTILATNKLYEFRAWQLECGGGTWLYNIVSNSAGYDYSYSPLICKIVGNR